MVEKSKISSNEYLKFIIEKHNLAVEPLKARNNGKAKNATLIRSTI